MPAQAFRCSRPAPLVQQVIEEGVAAEMLHHLAAERLGDPLRLVGGQQAGGDSESSRVPLLGPRAIGDVDVVPEPAVGLPVEVDGDEVAEAVAAVGHDDLFASDGFAAGDDLADAANRLVRDARNEA